MQEHTHSHNTLMHALYGSGVKMGLPRMTPQQLAAAKCDLCGNKEPMPIQKMECIGGK